MRVLSEEENNQITIQRDMFIAKSNELIRMGRYDLSVTEQKVIGYIFSKIQREDQYGKEYTFSLKEYCNVAGIENCAANFDRIKDSLRLLRNKSFWVVREDGRHALNGWLQSVTIDPKKGMVSVTLDQDVQQYFIGLSGNYTQYQLVCLLPMQSKYAIRLYEYLKSFVYKSKYNANGQAVELLFDNLEELKTYLGADVYKEFKPFRKRVLDPAVEEINKYTDINVTWAPICKGRRYTGLIITVSPKNQYEQDQAKRRASQDIEAIRVGREVRVNENGEMEETEKEEK